MLQWVLRRKCRGLTVASAGVEKIRLGLERLEKAGDDSDLLGAALTSIHGALEDRFRHLLATTPELPEHEHARVLDVGRVQWAELIDLMRLHAGLSAEDADYIRTMNRERQAVAHGGRYRGKRAAIERYAGMARSFFPEFEQQTVVIGGLKQEPMPGVIVPEIKPAAARRAKQSPASASDAKASERVAGERAPKPAAAPRARSRASAKAQPPARLNPGLTLTLVLVAIIGCAALSMLVQTEGRSSTPAAPTVAPPAPPLPTMSGPQPRTTTADLNLRAEPGLSTAILATIPAGAAVTIIADGPQRDGHIWVRVEYAGQTGWVDTAYLRP
jgi:Bacterial SH3 domain